MKWLICIFLILGLLQISFASSMSSENLSVGSYHQGLAGGEDSSENFTARHTTTYQQAGVADSYSDNLTANIGWFERGVTVVSECVNLSNPNVDYTLIKNVSANGTTCFNITAQNITFDCDGYTITGNNSTATYGVYSDQFGTTTKNCIIVDFHYDIYYNGSSNSTVQNNTLNTSHPSGYGLYIADANYCTIESNTLNHTNSSGGSPFIVDNSNYSYIANNTFSAFEGYSAWIYLSSDCDFIENRVLGGGAGVGVVPILQIEGDSNRISFNNITGNEANSNEFVFGIVANPADHNNFTNNSINMTNGTAINMDSTSTNNIFYYNNITGLVWINDSSSGTNFFNTTDAGNIYYFGNGTESWEVYDAWSIDNNDWADYGSDLPFNASLTEWAGLGNDSHPYTKNVCGNLNDTDTTYTMGANTSINGETCFNVTAENVSLDCAGYTITGNNSSSTYGVYSSKFNTTTRNCVINNFGTGIFYETNADNSTIENNTINITYSTSCDSASLNCHAIYLFNGVEYNIVENNSLYSISTTLVLYSNSNHNTIKDNRITTIGNSGIRIATSSSNRITSNNISSSNYAVYIITSNTNNITENNITASSDYAINLITNSINNNIVNNTLAAGSANTAISIGSGGGTGNKFYYNNITSSTWVNSLTAGNFFNTTGEGNIWYFANGTASWDVYNISSNSTSHWATNGTEVPLSNSTVSEWIGYNNDSHPWTNHTIPIIQYINLTPISPFDDENLLCNITVSDLYQSSLNISYEFYKNGANQTALANSINVTNGTNTNFANISNSLTSVGENWSCRAKAYNGSETTDWMMSPNRTIYSAAKNYTVTIARNYSEVNISCFQPYMENTEPNGQSSDVGIFNITSTNDTLTNLTLSVDNEMPTGFEIFAQPANYVHPGSISLNSTPQIILRRLSNNASKYIWLFGNCTNVSDDFNFTIEYRFGGG